MVGLKLSSLARVVEARGVRKATVGVAKRLPLPRSLKKGIITSSRYLTAGVMGSVVGGVRGANADWDLLTPAQKQAYTNAYGADAPRLFRNKQAVQGTVSGFIDGVGVAAGITGARKTIRRALPYIRSKGLIKGVKEFRSQPKIEKASRGLLREFVLPATLEAGAVYGSANLYGEAARYAHNRRGQREDLSPSKRPAWTPFKKVRVYGRENPL
jgi:hypothetical protein